MGLRVFVAMPYGRQDNVDFDRVYQELIRPALAGVAFDVFRADEERRAGEIRTDMFQQLLLADLVVADLTLDNPNVWYELGVRHALRARNTLLISARTDRSPFDVYTDRKLRYHLRDGAPDPAKVDADRAALNAMALATISSWQQRRDSPVYHLLPNLAEPDWRSLRIGDMRELWVQQEEWERRLRVAGRKQRPGDVLVLAEEAPAQALRREGYLAAARTLRQLDQPRYALEQVEKALALDPTHLAARQEKGILLGRLRRYDEAKEWLQAVARDHRDDAETCALLGRVWKDEWVNGWRVQDADVNRMREEAALESDLLDESAGAYEAGFRSDPSHFYSGVNAATLLRLLRHLGRNGREHAATEDVAGGVRWAILCALARETTEQKDFWARVSLAELGVLSLEAPEVRDAYAHAVSAAEKDGEEKEPRRLLS